jgi:alpha,alpha-trehalase
MTSPQQLGPQFSAERLRPILGFIDGYWKKLERYRPHDDGTLVGLPRPYFVPSVDTGTGFAFEEMFYWDSYFIAQGLRGTSREHLIPGLVENLATMMQRFNVVPNSSRTFFTGRSQPPFLTSLVLQAYEFDHDKRWLSSMMSVAKEEYRTVWMGTAQPNWRQVFHGLSRNYDVNVLDDLAECESGWDYNTRFDRKALSFIPVDLNALLYKYETDFEQAANILGDKDEAKEWTKRALSRRAALHEYLWNDEKGCYFDYNFMSGKQSPVYSLAAFYPMWAGMDDAKTAERVMANLGKFEFEGGLSTSAKEPEITMTIPTQWAYPNGWAPLQLIAIEAMQRYGYHVDAERVARKWILANLLRFEETGELFEKYNVVDVDAEPVEGVYPSQSGFGWTNAVFVRLCQHYLRADELPHIESVHRVQPLQELVRNPRRTLRRVGLKLNDAVVGRGTTDGV